MSQYEAAHDREQAEAAIERCVDILRAIGPGCIVCVMTEKGRVFRRISAHDAVTQTELMALTARQMNANLTDLAMAMSQVVDERNPEGHLDDHNLEEDIGP